MTSLIIAIGTILLMIALNGFFALSEMAVVSSRKARLKMKADEGRASYGAALRLAEDPGPFLSTIQTGITLVGVLAGAYGEASLSKELESLFVGLPYVARYSRALSIAAVVIVITFLSIVFGELIPKRLALRSPERLAAAVSFPIRAVTLVLFPFSRVLTGITDGVMRLLRLKQNEDVPVSGEEIRILLREGEKYGSIRKQHGDVVEAALDIHATRLGAIMTPRPEIRYIEVTESPKRIRDRIVDHATVPYLPVCRNGLDTIVGFVKTQEVLQGILKGTFKSLGRHIRKPLYVPESMGPIRLLEQFKKNRTHIAFVIDEYGGVTGLVTLNDITEEIVGRTPSGTAGDDDEIVQRKDGSYLVDGVAAIDDVHDRFGLGRPGGDYHTLAGFVMDHLGRIPRTGETFTVGGYELEIVDMDGNRIDKVLVRPLKK